MNEQMVQAARQAAHDIRSPLSALKMLVRSLKEDAAVCADKQSLLERVIERIDSIAEELLRGARECEVQVKHCSMEQVTAALRTLVEEKKAEHQSGRGVEISFTPPSLVSESTVPMHDEAVARVVSNLVNNSVEALAKNVVVQVTEEREYVAIVVEDDGVGFSGGAQKPSSNGLGLKHASQVALRHGGKLAITGSHGGRTRVSLILPRAS